MDLNEHNFDLSWTGTLIGPQGTRASIVRRQAGVGVVRHDPVNLEQNDGETIHVPARANGLRVAPDPCPAWRCPAPA